MKNEILKNIEIRNMPETHVAYVRHIGPYQGNDKLFRNLIKKLMNWAGPRALIKFPETKMINIYHDNPNITDDNKLITSVCITVPEDTKVGGEVGKMSLESGECLVGNFELSSEKFGEAWSQMYKRVMENGYQPDDRMAYEICLNDPNEHPEHKHIVDICDNLYIISDGTTYLTKGIQDLETLGYARVNEQLTVGNRVGCR